MSLPYIPLLPSLPHQAQEGSPFPFSHFLLISSPNFHISLNKHKKNIVMMMKMKKIQFFSSLLPLLLILLSNYSTTTIAQSPASAPSAPAPSPSAPPPTDIIRILKKAGGFTTLIRLLQTTQVSTQINSQLMNSNGGLTLFAPNDNAFSSLKPGFLNSLTDQQKNELIQFHLLPSFVSTSSFDTLSNPVRTQAGENPDRLALNVTSSGNQVNLTTGIVNTTVGGTVYSDKQLAVYQVDKVLLPRDFFVAKPPAPAPSPSSDKGKGSKKKSAEGPSAEADHDESSAFSFMMMQGNLFVTIIAVSFASLFSL